MQQITNYLNYGIPSDVADQLSKINLPVTTIRYTSKKGLINKYGLSPAITVFIKKCVTRDPIDPKVLQKLLEKSLSVCCICKGIKSSAIIIHHITPWSESQDNAYSNLAVLCPTDHDLSHRDKEALTKRYTPKEIRQFKKEWEKEAKEHKKRIAGNQLSEFDIIDKSKINFITKTLSDNKAFDIPCDFTINNHTRLLLQVIQKKTEQEFVVYLQIMTDQASYKWIGFGTPLTIKNVYESEHVYRIGKPGKTKYNTVEYVIDRINESGLKFVGTPVRISKIRFWGWHKNKDDLSFEAAII